MAQLLPDPKELARYYSLAQVGLEMVVPIALGVWLDSRFGLMPWCTVAGVVVGLVGGMAHLLVMLKRFEKPGPPTSGEGRE